MSGNTRHLRGTGCGCNTVTPVRPDNLTIVPAGSTIVQAPCGENCAPPSSANLSLIQAPGQESGCDAYRNPCVTNTFAVPATGRSGSFYAACASAWALPGLLLYFPGRGHARVEGATGNVVTYTNLTIEPGTEILGGTCFHHDAPAPVTETGEDEETGELETSATLDALYGVEGNTPKKILPANGSILYGCGEKWLRRAAGLMFYPMSRTELLSFTGSVGAKSWTLNFPNLPASSVLTCSPGLYASIDINLVCTKTTSSSGARGTISVDGIEMVTCVASEGSRGNSVQNALVNIGKGNSSKPATFGEFHTISGYGVGNIQVKIHLNGYYY